MIIAIAQSAKLLGFVMLFAFVFQTFTAQAEHVGAIDCVSDLGKTSPDTQDQDTQPCDDCCSHLVALIQITDSFSWISVPSVSFNNLDDLLPAGPTAAIDQPPRVA